MEKEKAERDAEGLVILTQTQAAKFLRLTVRTLQRWRTIKIGPPFFKLSPRKLYYRKPDLEVWLRDNSKGGICVKGR